MLGRNASHHLGKYLPSVRRGVGTRTQILRPAIHSRNNSHRGASFSRHLGFLSKGGRRVAKNEAPAVERSTRVLFPVPPRSIPLGCCKGPGAQLGARVSSAPPYRVAYARRHSRDVPCR